MHMIKPYSCNKIFIQQVKHLVCAIGISIYYSNWRFEIEVALEKYAVIQHLNRRVNLDAVGKLVMPVYSRLMVALDAYHA